MRLAPRNPVLDRELRERLRTRRATVVLTWYLIILSLVLYAIYSAQVSSQRSGFGDPFASQSAGIGRTLFETIVIVMLGLVLFIVPGLTADALTGERERQTLVPLQVTLLRPRSIVVGKLLAALAFVTLLVVATLPLIGVSFILGGVVVTQVAKAVVAVLATGVVVAAVALACSGLAKRTQGAMVLAYGVALFLTLGIPAIYAGQGAIDDDGRDPAPTVLLLSPFVATADFVAPPSDPVDGLFRGASSPLASMSQGVRDLEVRTTEGRFGNGADQARALDQGFDRGFEVVTETEFEQATTTVLEIIEGGDVVVLGGEPGERVVVGGTGPGGELVLEGPLDEAQLGAQQRLQRGLVDIPLWVRSTVVLGVLALLALVVATRRITTPSDRTAA